MAKDVLGSLRSFLRRRGTSNRQAGGRVDFSWLSWGSSTLHHQPSTFALSRRETYLNLVNELLRLDGGGVGVWLGGSLNLLDNLLISSVLDDTGQAITYRKDSLHGLFQESTLGLGQWFKGLRRGRSDVLSRDDRLGRSVRDDGCDRAV